MDKEKVGRCINIISEIASLLVMIKGKPTLTDFVAVGAKSVDIAFRVQNEMYGSIDMYCWDYFANESVRTAEWVQMASIFEKFIMPQVKDRIRMTKAYTPTSHCAWEGKYYDYPIGWIGKDDTGEKIEALFVKTRDKDNILASISSNFWRSYTNQNIYWGDAGMMQDELNIEGIFETDFIKDSLDLIKKFIAAGESHSFLFIGEPGVGKTKAIQYIIKNLGLSSLRLPLKNLSNKSGGDGKLDIKSIINITKPDVVIIDDIDRACSTVQNELLEFVDTNKSSVKLLLASANHVDRINKPLLRPGRLDEHIYVKSLDPNVIKKFLGDNSDLSDDMLDWPISYISLFNTYFRVFGLDKSTAMIPDLKKRLEDSREKRMWEYE